MVISSFRGDHHFLSNFYPHPFEYEGLTYPNAEAAFQAQKFAVPELAQLLLATGGAYLEEGNHWHDNRWGRCTCEKCRVKEGQNWLGKILMGIRDELNAA